MIAVPLITNRVVSEPAFPRNGRFRGLLWLPRHSRADASQRLWKRLERGLKSHTPAQHPEIWGAWKAGGTIGGSIADYPAKFADVVVQAGGLSAHPTH